MTGLRKLTLPVRGVSGRPAELKDGYYEAEALRHMRTLMERADSAEGDERAALINELHVLHELHAEFPPVEGRASVRMLTLAESMEKRREWGEVEAQPLTGHGEFRIPESVRAQTALFGEVDEADPEPPAWSTPLVPSAPSSAASRLADFDGETYVRALDHERLGKQLLAVGRLMADGGWHTLASIAATTGHPEASVSARIRDLRKRKFGSHTVNRERVESGQFRYRLVLVSYETPWGVEVEQGVL